MKILVVPLLFGSLTFQGCGEPETDKFNRKLDDGAAAAKVEKEEQKIMVKTAGVNINVKPIVKSLASGTKEMAETITGLIKEGSKSPSSEKGDSTEKKQGEKKLKSHKTQAIVGGAVALSLGGVALAVANKPALTKKYFPTMEIQYKAVEEAVPDEVKKLVRPFVPTFTGISAMGIALAFSFITMYLVALKIGVKGWEWKDLKEALTKPPVKCALYLLGAFHHWTVLGQKYSFYRHLTSMFLHETHWDLLLSVMTIGLMGQLMNDVFDGPLDFLVMFVLLGIFSNMTGNVMSTKEQKMMWMGASGAIHGLLGMAWGTVIPKLDKDDMPQPGKDSKWWEKVLTGPLKLIIPTVLAVLMNISAAKRVIGTHIGGFYVGFWLAIMLRRRDKTSILSSWFNDVKNVNFKESMQSKFQEVKQFEWKKSSHWRDVFFARTTGVMMFLLWLVPVVIIDIVNLNKAGDFESDTQKKCGTLSEVCDLDVNDQNAMFEMEEGEAGFFSKMKNSVTGSASSAWEWIKDKNPFVKKNASEEPEEAKEKAGEGVISKAWNGFIGVRPHSGVYKVKLID